MFDKPGTGFNDYLKSKGRKSSELPLDDLRRVKEFEKMVEDLMRINDKLGASVAAIHNSFIKAQIFGLALSVNNQFPSLKNCLDDLMGRFADDVVFQDGVGLHAWAFLNFPATRGGRPIGCEIAETMPELKPFLDVAVKTRMGVFEIIKGTNTECYLCELFTGKQLKLTQSLETLGGISVGNLILARPISIFGEHVVLGDISEFPAANRSKIEDMISRKMTKYFHHEDDSVSYETMMTLAGPYWFSMVAKGKKNDILSPDHYLKYYSQK